jgi:glycosyltransferase involved in cell wall biosynthesis
MTTRSTTEPNGLRALVIHDFYRSENASGENLSVRDEINGLRSLGWDVEVISADSDVIGNGTIPLGELAVRPIYSRRSVLRVRDAARRFRPHVALVENLFPLHSPWVIRELRSLGVPVAAGVRSYRMVCAASTLFRDGAVCRDCIGSRINLPAIRHGCYQNMRSRTAPLAASLALHRGTFRSIDRLLAVSEFVRDELIAAGFDPGRIVVRPNFVPDPGPPIERVGDGFLFAGRLTPDKGIAPMLEGWARSGAWRRHRLRIAGSGPLDSLVIGLDPALRVEPLGLLGHEATLATVRDAAVTVVPSVWPEPFGRGVIEAAAHGRPALVCRSGGLGSLVADGVTGWVAEPDADGLAAAFRRAADPQYHADFGRAARARYLAHHTRGASLGVLDRELRSLVGAGEHT